MSFGVVPLVLGPGSRVAVRAELGHRVVCEGTSGRRSPAPGEPSWPDGAFYWVRYCTGLLIISHSPVSLSYLQLQKASQFWLSMLGLSARK